MAKRKTKERLPFDTTWYVEETRIIAEAKLRVEMARFMEPLEPGHIYVVQVAPGVVKVGKTTQPKTRLATHAQMAQIHGGEGGSSWVSKRLVGYNVAERELIGMCSRAGKLLAGREYFDLDFRSAWLAGTLIESNRLSVADLPPEMRDALEPVDTPG